MKRFFQVAIISLLLPAALLAQQQQANTQAKKKKSSNQSSTAHKPKTNKPSSSAYNSSSAATRSSSSSTKPSNSRSHSQRQAGQGVAASDTGANATTGDAPKTAADFFKLGQAHYREHRYREAVEAYKRSISLNANDERTHYELGLAYYSIGLYGDAASAFRQAARLNPKSADAHFRLGWMNYVMGKKKAATQEYELLKTLDPAMAQKLYRIINEGSGSATAEHTNASPQQGAERTTQASAQSAEAQPEPTVTSVLRTSSERVPLAASESTPSSGEAGSAPGSSSPPSPATVASSDAALNRTASTPGGAPSTPGTTAAPTTEVVVAPPADAPSTTIYKVGVGDILDVRIPNSPVNRSTLYTVLDGGVLDFPLAGGPIRIAGMTTEQVGAKLAAELRRRNVQDASQVVVSVREFASHTILVSGLVSYPGSRVLRREAVPLYVVLAEAQPRPEAGRVTIMREGAQVTTVDLNDPASTGLLIRPGDVITVSARQQQFYYIGGRVNSPGQKIFQPGITLTQAILAAGGLTRSGENEVEVSREGTDGRLTTTRYVLRDIKSGRTQDPHLQPGDRIEVGH